MKISPVNSFFHKCNHLKNLQKVQLSYCHVVCKFLKWLDNWSNLIKKWDLTLRCMALGWLWCIATVPQLCIVHAYGSRGHKTSANQYTNYKWWDRRVLTQLTGEFSPEQIKSHGNIITFLIQFLPIRSPPKFCTCHNSPAFLECCKFCRNFFLTM